jgi:dTDP-glucose pyrophosphorylase
MDEGGKRILFVVENNLKLYGILADGDIRRWILRTGELKGYVSEFCNTNPIVVHVGYQLPETKKIMLEQRLEAIPVLDNDNKIVEILLWEDIFSEKRPIPEEKKIKIPVVIMAGGKGSRLDPFTRVLPKPLIPIGNKPIIEIIIDKFYEYGACNFYISVNHKSKMIKAYFEELSGGYTINYIDEDKPLGTAGSLKFLENKLSGSFFVSNCDILIESDYSEILEYHNEKKNDMTLVASVKNYRIPYGICEIENGGALCRIREKPEYNFLVNTGLYVLESESLDLIPENEYFDITDLMKKLREQGRKIGVFPVSDKSWIDVGEWDEYRKAVRRFEA